MFWSFFSLSPNSKVNRKTSRISSDQLSSPNSITFIVKGHLKAGGFRCRLRFMEDVGLGGFSA